MFLDIAKKWSEDTNRFWAAQKDIRPQGWSAPHRIAYQDAFSRVLVFEPTESWNGQAVILNPPRAGHHSNIGQPLAMLLSEMGFVVYAIDHLGATPETKNFGLDAIYDEMDLAFEVACEDQHEQYYDYFAEKPFSPIIHLIGLCQGGWATAIWAALNPDAGYASLTIAGTPIDFQIDGGKIQHFLSMTSDAYFESVIENNDGLWPGEKQLEGFKALNPVDRYFGTYVDLQKAIVAGNEKAVEKWIRNNSWYEACLDLPGKMIRQVIGDLFRANKLVKGELMVKGRRVDLSNIFCPVACITGGIDNGADGKNYDDITLERQCTALLDHVSSEVKTHRAVPNCGHIAIYLKKAALLVWVEVMDEMSKAFNLR